MIQTMNLTETSSFPRSVVGDLRSRVSQARLVQNCGRVSQMIGLVIESIGPIASVGEICSIDQQGRAPTLLAEVVGFRDKRLLLMPLGEVHGICPGSEVVATGHSLRVPVGDELLGRVIDGMGHPLDDRGEIPKLPLSELDLSAPHPLKRARIDKTFQTGIKAIDTFVPIGRGQRLGIFSGSGVGKSTLMGMMASKAEADVNVIALIGEPPSSRGYPPSVFSMLPQLLERAGNNDRGSITGLFNVLVEADDMNDPIADATRSVLDGHLVLSRELAAHNHYPAIDVLQSVSRLNQDLLSEPEQALTGESRDTMATYRKNQDLISIGAYKAGSNPTIDRAIRLHEPFNQFLRQDYRAYCSRDESWKLLRGVVGPMAETRESGAATPAPAVHAAAAPASQAPRSNPGWGATRLARVAL